MHTANDLKGVHFAVARNNLLPGVWETDLFHTWNCQLPGCTLAFDNRISAVHLRYKWALINPAQGVYDFSDLDGVLAEIISAGKKATLIIMAGKYTPEWVIKNGVVTVPAMFSSDFYTGGRAPMPHDAVYRDAYHTMIKALATHIKASTAKNDALVLVKNGLTTTHSGETRIIPTKPFDFGGRWDIDVPAEETAAREWLANAFTTSGYQTALMLETIAETCDVILDEFPDQLTGLTVVKGSKRFPTNGVGVKAGSLDGNTTLQDACVALATKHGARSVSNDTTLVLPTDVQTINDPIKAAGGHIGFQINAVELGYRDSGAVNDPTGLSDAFTYAHGQGALFVEIHDGNMQEHASTLIAGNTLLQS